MGWGSGKSTRGVKRWAGIGIERGMTPVEFILFVVAAYVVVGVVFGVLFATMGVGRVDEAAAGARWLFRVFILPGAAALWPVMLWKWVRAGRSAGDGGHGS